MSEESKRKMRGPRPNTSRSLKGKKKTKKHRENLSKSTKGKRLSQKTKDKISKKMILRNSSLEYRNKIAKKLGSKEFEVRRNNNFIGIWISQRQCARELNLQQAHITKCLKGIYKQHKGYVFNFLGEKNVKI